MSSALRRDWIDWWKGTERKYSRKQREEPVVSIPAARWSMHSAAMESGGRGGLELKRAWRRVCGDGEGKTQVS